MKTYQSKSTQENPESNTLWDSFVAYMDQVYFDGATDELETKLVTFEYENFTNDHSK